MKTKTGKRGGGMLGNNGDRIPRQMNWKVGEKHFIIITNMFGILS
jgi:hypothetical protein